MIPLTLAEVAAAVGGTLEGGADPDAAVTGGVTVDSRAVAAGDLFVAVPGERVDGHRFAEAAVTAGALAVIATKPVEVPSVLVDDAVIALGRLAAAVRDRLPALRVVGVTGSSGKTSTKDLLHAVLATAGPTIAPQGSYNNEFGVPLTLLRADFATRYLVSEMGARGVGHIAYLCSIARPQVGVVLNVGAAHAGEFGSREVTALAKGELVEALPPAADGGVAVLNADDRFVAGMATRTHARVVRTAVSAPAADVRAEAVSLDAEARPSFDLVTHIGTARVELRLHGAHHVANALSAAAVGLDAGLTPAQVAAALSTAEGASRWRMEVSRTDAGLTVINDAYNANPDSVAAALRALAAMSQRGWAVLGEMLELGPDTAEEHRAIGRLAAELGLAGVIAVGGGAAPVAEGAAAGGLAARFAGGPDEAFDLFTAVQQGSEPADAVLVKASRSVGLEKLAARLSTVGGPWSGGTGRDGEESA